MRPDRDGPFALDRMAAHAMPPYLAGVVSQLDGGRKFGAAPLHPCYSAFAGSSACWPSERATRMRRKGRSAVWSAIRLGPRSVTQMSGLSP